MLTRRHFLKSTTMASAAGLLASQQLFAQPPFVDNIGIQFFSLPKLLEKDFPGTVAMLAKMGYKEVELYGPYSFSAEASIKGWQSVTPMLGFSGSGFFGLSAEQVSNLMKQHGLSVPSMHTDLETLQTRMNELAAAAKVLGATYVVLPAIPDGKRKTLDDYKRIAEDFNKIGEAAKKNGIRFAYHNHGYGLKEMNGQIPLNIILDGTDPGLVFLEMDLFWTVAGGADPVTYLEKYSNRYHLMHVKDMSENKRFAGDGGDASQWIALFPYMTNAGSGILDLKTIIPKAKQHGVKHFIVEQDMVANPETALKKSFDYLAALK